MLIVQCYESVGCNFMLCCAFLALIYLLIHPFIHPSVSYLKDLEPSNVQHSYEILALHLGVQRLVDAGHHPLEHAVVDGLAQSADGVHTLVLGLTFQRTQAHI